MASSPSFLMVNIVYLTMLGFLVINLCRCFFLSCGFHFLKFLKMLERVAGIHLKKTLASGRKQSNDNAEPLLKLSKNRLY